ncbi:MAG TPA: hypothetical protein VNQ32_12885 [Steroidobacteraceae bacterium]|nr:hypothetical protein [Steroidobacteraceae bacterium]
MKHTCLYLATGLLLASSLQAAEPPEGPAVNTSPAPSAPREDGRAPPRRPQIGLASGAPAANPAPAANAAAPSPPAAAPRASSADRIELGTTQITGNSELPRVMYVVPWKRAELGDLAGRPARSLLDEVLAPVDRDVFRRQNRYYDALQPDAAAAAPEGEK